MNLRQLSAILFAISASAVLSAQQASAPTPSAAAPRPPRTAYYIDANVLDVAILLPAPPAPDSVATQADLAEIHRIEQARTPAQAAAAKADDTEEDIFIYKSVFGPGFTAQALPITAALGAHVYNEQGVVGRQLKAAFPREHPYQIDPTVHPVCGVVQVHDSYPGGHAITGYLMALTLAELVPEKKNDILARAAEYAHSRVVCGVQYPSDVEAASRAAYVVFGYMMATPRFQTDLKLAREELRKAGLTDSKN